MEKGLESIHIANNFGADNFQAAEASAGRNRMLLRNLHIFADLHPRLVVPK
jgi:hypothetical protein